MLVLTRNAKDGIAIGDKIRLVILGVKGGRVRIGIDAPRDVSVLREELKQRDGQRRSQPVTP